MNPVRVFNAGPSRVLGPEAYWMQCWNTREEINILIYVMPGVSFKCLKEIDGES
jgi:hypothetical protein